MSAHVSSIWGALRRLPFAIRSTCYAYKLYSINQSPLTSTIFFIVMKLDLNGLNFHTRPCLILYTTSQKVGKETTASFYYF